MEDVTEDGRAGGEQTLQGLLQKGLRHGLLLPKHSLLFPSPLLSLKMLWVGWSWKRFQSRSKLGKLPRSQGLSPVS